ncbi:FeoA family protein [Mailhella massiliensis]|uniref:Ferrous iron transport protein A n=1 Tax=Mailhella massiliensis TaxID=1903261 RepID=A0A921AXT5_9BACT|nr:FeoA family protein [Mailhella massiliensis]HJD97876.1 ferrous iron transport protein A [Mailhella massiliensis]
MSQMNLRRLVPGQKASIVRINAYGELGRRIRDMGLVPGMSVQVVGRAPLRDPVALRIEGSTIALRNSEADFVDVEVR